MRQIRQNPHEKWLGIFLDIYLKLASTPYESKKELLANVDQDIAYQQAKFINDSFAAKGMSDGLLIATANPLYDTPLYLPNVDIVPSVPPPPVIITPSKVPTDVWGALSDPNNPICQFTTKK